MIYSFPALPLAVIWWIKAIGGTEDRQIMYVIVIVHIFLYFLFKVVRIWADGDNDLFFLFAAVYSTVHGISAPLSFITVELISIVMVMSVAMIIGYGEARRKKEKLSSCSSIAVAPGFALSILVFMILYVQVRWF